MLSGGAWYSYTFSFDLYNSGLISRDLRSNSTGFQFSGFGGIKYSMFDNVFTIIGNLTIGLTLLFHKVFTIISNSHLTIFPRVVG